ncbi:TrkA family potassium uptake protein [Halocella sp. SP3-1]|uniref:potassium channel family protein n=1 Tax=Halocella sp. SP3-1 TaxID=2382161 RepID=UPI000F7612DA|nr:TrkA family potassium uptake protein [Halocella sp. SP3-1]AZO95429.1 TrkA family potassium uptake protein [Halocella sp. SP3-1]
MYIVVIGSGRTGSKLAGLLSERGHDVVIIDRDAEQFAKLPIAFSGFKVEGDALEQEVLKYAKIEQADKVVITTGNDKVNYMVTQLVRFVFEVPGVLVRVVDPEKVRLFKKDPAVMTLSPLSLLVDEFAARVEGDEI